MDAKNKLLDAAKKICLTDSGTARRLDITRQTISHWRSGRYPMPEEQITAIAQIAHESPEKWLVLIAAEQSQGATHRAWLKAAERLGIAASLVMLLGGAAPPAGAFCAHQGTLTGGELCIMRTVRRIICKVREIITRERAIWNTARSAGYGTSPLLA